jgi:hypothetical protein
MTQIVLFAIACALAFVVGIEIQGILTRINLRHGWDAHRHGLARNLKWGREICEGWDKAQRGEPRP